MRGFKPIGKCIYCDRSEDLSKEHVFSYSMGGGLTLPEASCRRHRDVTSAFEREIARGMYWPLRIKEGYPSRDRDDWPSALPTEFRDEDGNPRLEQLLISEYPCHYPLVRFLEPPGFTVGKPPYGGNPAMSVDPRASLEGLGKAITASGHLGIVLKQTVDWWPYCRLLCKTAHAFACAVVGLAGWQPLLIPLIEGTANDFAHYLGAAERPPESLGDSAIALSWEQVADDQVLSVYLQRLGRLEIPLTKIVVGLVLDTDAMFTEAGRRGARRPPARTPG